MMLTALILCFVVMVIFNAFMDALEHHFSNSIFKNKNRFVWDPKESWRNKYDKHGYRKKILGVVVPAALSDPWHIFKSMFLLGAFIPNSILLEEILFEWYWNLLIIIVLWSVLFEIVYNISSGKKILAAWTKKK